MTCVARQEIIPIPTIKPIRTSAPNKNIVAPSSLDEIIAITAVKDIVPLKTKESIGRAIAGQIIGVAAAPEVFDQHIGVSGRVASILGRIEEIGCDAARSTIVRRIGPCSADQLVCTIISA